MGGDVWADQFLPIFDRKLNIQNEFVAQCMDRVMELINPEELHTLKQKVLYFIAFSHITRLLKTTRYIIVGSRSIRFTKLLAPYIEKKYPNVKLIVQFINTVQTEDVVKPDDYSNFSNCILYSFDPKDVEEYGMKKFNWYIDDKRLLEYAQIHPKYDVSFIGNDKGRVLELIRLSDIFDRYGITYDYYVLFKEGLESKMYRNKRTKGFKYGEVSLSTIEYQKRSCESKAILEIMQDGQVGTTLRAAESIFLQRKLITDNQYIVNEAFYNKDNVFILGKDKISGLKKFINTPYRVLSKEITDQYTYEYMLRQLDGVDSSL